MKTRPNVKVSQWEKINHDGNGMATTAEVLEQCHEIYQVISTSDELVDISCLD